MNRISTSRLGRLACVLAAIGLLGGLAAAAGEADKLARAANSELRRARGLMFGGKFDESLAKTKEVEELIAKIKAASPGHRSLRRLESTLERLKKDLQKRMGTATPTKPDKPTPKTPGAGDELPHGVAYRLKQIDRWLKVGNLGRAAGLMDEIETKYAGKFSPDRPDIKAAKARIAELKAKEDAAAQAKAAAKKKEEEAQAQREATSKTWLAKLAVYTTRYDSVRERRNPKYLEGSSTSDMAELKRQKALHDEASALLDEYKKASFPAGKTPELQQTEENFARLLKNLAEAYKTSMDRLASGPEKEIKQTMAWLASKQEWRTDPKEMPYTLSQKRLDPIQKAVDAAAASLPATDPKLVALKKQMAELVALNDKLRRVRIERTFMIPDRFKPPEAPALKAKANELVTKDFPDAKTLRTTIISRKWGMENVVEWTDTTRTKRRHRVTRAVTAQVAAKRDEAVFLYAVHVAQNRQPDGTWGPLYGNLHQSADLMLEKNVNASGP